MVWVMRPSHLGHHRMEDGQTQILPEQASIIDEMTAIAAAGGPEVTYTFYMSYILQISIWRTAWRTIV